MLSVAPTLVRIVGRSLSTGVGSIILFGGLKVFVIDILAGNERLLLAYFCLNYLLLLFGLSMLLNKFADHLIIKRALRFGS